MLNKVGDNANILALTFHPSKLCIDRGNAFEDAVKGKPNSTHLRRNCRAGSAAERQRPYTALADQPSKAAAQRKLGIWSCWDEPTTGAVAALRQGGRTDVVTWSINGSPQALQMVKDGDMSATTWQPAYEEGKLVFKAILESLAAGTSWTLKVITIPGVPMFSHVD